MKENSKKKSFNVLMITAFIMYVLVLILAIMLKTFMVEDLMVSYNYLSTFTLKERFIRGIKLIEFYKIEYELQIIDKTIILDLLNCIVFIPFGIFISHFIKKHKVLISVLITFLFSVFIELFQLFTIIGSFMLNDLITNVIGGLIGSILYVVITKNKKYGIYNILISVFLLLESILVLYLSIDFIDNIDIYKKIFANMI